MQKKTAAEMEKSKIMKAARTLIRLKHSLAADEELNETLHSQARTCAGTRTHSVHTYTRAGARAQT